MANRFAVGVVGLVGSLMTVVVVFSFSSLIYSGELGRFLPFGSALLLVGCMIMNLIAARGSSLPGSIIIHQDATTALVAATLGLVMANVAAGSQLATALVILAAGSLGTGVAMLALGWRKAGDLVRFVPVSVMGGFLAGTGWLLLVGAFDLTAGGSEISAVTLANFAAALVLGLVFTVALRSGRRAVVAVPTAVLGSVAAFYLLLGATDTSVADARIMGLLPLPTSDFAFADVALGAVDWEAVILSIPRLLVIPVVAALALLMNVGGLELLARRDADLDRELLTAGWANVATAVTGAPGAYHTLGLSALGFRLDLHSRAVPLMAAAACGGAAVFGPDIVSALPLALIGGILAMVGLGFLTDWLVAAKRRMSVAEYTLMLAIVVVIAMFGFMPGVLFGMAAAIVLFTIKYSRTDPIRHGFTAGERASSIDRPPGERRALARWAARVFVAELQGFLFFGTAHKAVKALEERIRSDDLRFLVVDFRRVEGLDSTAVFSFARLQQTAVDAEVSLVFSNAGSVLAESLDKSERVTFKDDIDQALEWCEDRLLVGEAVDREDHGHLLGDAAWQRLLPYMDRLDLDENSVLADMGEDADCVYFIESGRIAVELPVDGDRWQRVRSVGHGNLLGEFALYVDGGRSARLRAEMQSTVLRLTSDAVDDLESTDAGSAIAFHRAVAHTMADRLMSTNDFVRALIR